MKTKTKQKRLVG